MRYNNSENTVGPLLEELMYLANNDIEKDIFFILAYVLKPDLCNDPELVRGINKELLIPLTRILFIRENLSDGTDASVINYFLERVKGNSQ